MSVLDREILALVRRATEEVILPHYRNLGEAQVEEKAPNDLVTAADRESEALLAEGLAKLNPGIAIVGEEAADADPGVMDRLAGPCWIIDPIDGTNNFANGRAPFGILIALAEDGIAQSGWIYDCLTGRFCAAHRGKGAFVGGDPIQARTTDETPPVAAISTVFLDISEREAIREHIAPHYRMVDIPRCAAEQYPRLALGENDVSVFNRALPWDHAAGALWLNEAGGMVARPDGAPYRVDEWERTGLIGAATPALWEELTERLRHIS
ncbi:inositol monophosphatase [Erythrobacter sp. LQ02-29]|uniref:inositol monophosphatase family protein n=1 Tax=Erythrobacter sp. LQ02-29 TaxID=2920384 RepID=UPI001F4E79D5|nr:inositol monophosphatase [Erythrobacter sp. LQ02-29]